MVGTAGVWALEDVEAVTADTLDERAVETVRGLLARQDEPGYLVGFEQRAAATGRKETCRWPRWLDL